MNDSSVCSVVFKNTGVIISFFSCTTCTCSSLKSLSSLLLRFWKPLAWEEQHKVVFPRTFCNHPIQVTQHIFFTCQSSYYITVSIAFQSSKGYLLFENECSSSVNLSPGRLRWFAYMFWWWCTHWWCRWWHRWWRRWWYRLWHVFVLWWYRWWHGHGHWSWWHRWCPRWWHGFVVLLTWLFFKKQGKSQHFLFHFFQLLRQGMYLFDQIDVVWCGFVVVVHRLLVCVKAVVQVS